MAAGELSFAIRAVNEAKAALNSVERDIGGVGDAAGRAGPHTSRFGSALADVGKIAAGFVVAEGLMKLPGFLTSAAKGAAEDEAATARLRKTFQNYADMAGAAPDTFARLNGLLESRVTIGQKLAFTDDEMRDSFSFLLTATDDSTEATKRQTAAMDLARGANIPLATATKMLGKINEENVNSFRKMGIELPKTATEADALAAIQARFAGQAEAYAKSTAGQFAQLKIRLAEAKETIGAALLPVMVRVGEVLLNDVAPAVERFANAVGPGLVGAFSSVREAVQPVLARLQPLADWFVNNEAAMKAAGVAIGTILVAAFGAWAVSAGLAAVATLAAAAPVLAVVVAVGLLAAGVYLLVTHWDQVTAKFPIAATALEGVKAVFERFTGWITGTFVPDVQRLYTVWSENIGKVVAFVRDHWGEIEAVIKPALDVLKVVIETAWAQIQTVIETAFGVIKGAYEVFMGVFTGDWQRAWNGVKDIFAAVWQGFKETVRIALDALKDLAPIAKEAGKAILQALWDGILWVFDQLRMWLPAIPGAVLGMFGDAASFLYEVGKDLIRGLWNGAEAMKDWAIGQFRGLAGSILDGIKGALGIGSPSRRMAEEVGMPIVQGIAMGMVAAAPMLLATAASIANMLPGGGAGSQPWRPAVGGGAPGPMSGWPQGQWQGSAGGALTWTGPDFGAVWNPWTGMWDPQADLRTPEEAGIIPVNHFAKEKSGHVNNLTINVSLPNYLGDRAEVLDVLERELRLRFA